MRPGQYVTSAKCPYYKREGSHGIFCHGLQANTSIHYTFGDAAKCLEHKTAFCRDAKACMKCPIYYMLHRHETESGE